MDDSLNTDCAFLNISRDIGLCNQVLRDDVLCVLFFSKSARLQNQTMLLLN